MEEEAAVLQQRLVMGVGKETDLGVGEDQAAYHIISQEFLESLAQWALYQRLPGAPLQAGRERLLPLLASPQWLDETGPDQSRQGSFQLQKPLVALPLLGAGQSLHSRLRGLFVYVRENQGAVPTVTLEGSARGDISASPAEIESQILDDSAGEQADQVGVAGEVRVHSRENSPRLGCSSQFGASFQDQN